MILIDSKDITSDELLDILFEQTHKGVAVYTRHEGRLYQFVPLTPDEEEQLRGK